jgi:hypothetical protein
VGPRAGADDVDESGIEERADCVWRCCAEPGHLHRADGDRVGLCESAVGAAGSSVTIKMSVATHSRTYSG